MSTKEMLAVLAVLATLAVAGCGSRPGVPAGSPAHLDASWTAAIDDSAREFARSIAEGITRDGPLAWRTYFVDEPAFFMASEGTLVFPSGDSAVRGIQRLPKFISSIELRWQDSVRVDALGPGVVMLAMPYDEKRTDPAKRQIEERGYFTGVAVHGADGWRLQNAHWSVVPAASKEGTAVTSIPIHQDVDFAAGPSRIYEALLNDKEFAAFAGRPATIDREVGGTFTLFSGQRIVQAWRVVTWPEGVYSIVRFELQSRGSGTRLVFDHTGFPADERAHLAAGWSANYWTLLDNYLR